MNSSSSKLAQLQQDKPSLAKADLAKDGTIAAKKIVTIAAKKITFAAIVLYFAVHLTHSILSQSEN